MLPLFQLFLLLFFFCSSNATSLNSSTTYNGSNYSNGNLKVDDVFNLPYPLPTWPAGGGFAGGTIDLGGLLVKPVSTFNKVWTTYQSGPQKDGATFFEPAPLPDEFFMLGSYAQSNGQPLYGSVLVAKEVTQGALFPPIDYKLVWNSEFSSAAREGNGYIWLPIAPAGFIPADYVITNSPEKPSLDKVMCVRSDFTDSCENDNYIWSDDGIQIHGLKPSKRGSQAQALSPGTFNAEHTPGNFVSCLKNLKNDLTSMPNLDQVNALFKAYSPWVMFHPNEEFFPSSVSWFWKNGALLYKKGNESNPIEVEPTGSNLPMNAPNDGSYWFDLPKIQAERDRVRKGDLQDAGAYLHIKPVFGGTYTDIVVWLFYPFNGNSNAEILRIKFSLGHVGEHVGDWEHITLRISNFNGELKSVYLSQHKYGEWVPAHLILYKNGNKPLIYSCRHSHAHASFPGEELFGGFGSTGLLAEPENSNLVLDTGAKFLIIGAEYLGPSIVEPPWLNYANKWGPKIDYDIKDRLKKVGNALPGKLGKAFENFVSNLPEELLGQEGPLGPKMKDNWNGDENVSKDWKMILGSMKY